MGKRSSKDQEEIRRKHKALAESIERSAEREAEALDEQTFRGALSARSVTGGKGKKAGRTASKEAAVDIKAFNRSYREHVREERKRARRPRRKIRRIPRISFKNRHSEGEQK